MTTETQINKAWNNAKVIRNKNSDKYRKDPYGNVMYKDSYGQSSNMGWEVDHINPVNRGGSDSTRNLQALNTSVNRSKGDSLVKKNRHSQINK